MKQAVRTMIAAGLDGLVAAQFVAGGCWGAVSVGASWAFTKNVSVILGYDVYNRKATGGTPTFTTQLDINFP